MNLITEISEELEYISETTEEGSGGVQITNTNLDLKSGITIYGRYTEIDVNAGQIIAYIGQ